MQKPQWKKHLYVDFVEPDTLFLLTETDYQVAIGRAYQHLAPLLNGQHTIAEILIMLSGKVSPQELYAALGQLIGRGFVAEASEALPAEEAAFWQLLGADAATVPDRQRQITVAMRALDGCRAEALGAALEGAGIRLHADQDASLTIVVTDDYLRPELATLNRDALASSLRWMPVKLVGNVIWLGPLFEPGTTACWACLAQRLTDR